MLDDLIFSASPFPVGLLITSVIFGALIGMVVTLAMIMLMQPTTGNNPGDLKSEISNLKSRASAEKSRESAAERAALQARMMVASGAFQPPTRR